MHTIPVRYVLNEAPKKDKNSNQKSKSPKPEATYKDSLLEHKLNWLAKLEYSSEEGTKLYKELAESGEANHVQLEISRLASLEADKVISNEDKHNTMVDLCQSIVEKITIDEILIQSAIRHDNRTDAQDIKKDMEKSKGWYIEAQVKRGLAYCVKQDIEGASQVCYKI